MQSRKNERNKKNEIIHICYYITIDGVHLVVFSLWANKRKQKGHREICVKRWKWRKTILFRAQRSPRALYQLRCHGKEKLIGFLSFLSLVYYSFHWGKQLFSRCALTESWDGAFQERLVSNVSAAMEITDKRRQRKRERKRKWQREKGRKGEGKSVGKRIARMVRVHVNVGNVRSKVFPHNWSW